MKKVLIVDDEEAILRALFRALRREAYEIVTASDFDAACKAIDSARPQVVLSDYRMPTGTGLDIARYAKQVDPSTRCVVLTGCGDEESGRLLSDAPEVDVLLLKPWQNEALRELLRDLIGQSS